MSKNLLIVESPAKAKTIEKILGSDFEVKSCYGHIRDLDKGDKGIDIANNFKPNYIIAEDKAKVVKELKSLAKKSKEVWLASDEDREGESISWHLAEVLGLDPSSTKRIVFHEITKPAIKKAVENPRTIDLNLVNAQQARRVLDRLVGFELSSVLWRKIGMRQSLSAGRVQSVAVKLIVEREREINNFTPVSSFKTQAVLAANENNKLISFKANGKTYTQQKDAQAFLESCKNANYKVVDIQVKPSKRSPAAPFTTSTLQQEASRKLGYGVSKTMLLAQKLYEAGHITYMRTDAVNLSETALNDIQSAVVKNYGDSFHQLRRFKNKNDNAQEAHEAIRPTYMETTQVDDSDTQRLYDLIWKRTMACQMADAEIEKTNVKIEISTNKETLSASGEVIKFEGFLKAYAESTDEDDADEEKDDARLPIMNLGDLLQFRGMHAVERFTRPSSRYTEAMLVKKLEELGIGRPSTYAPTLSTIQKRGYAEKVERPGVQRKYRKLQLDADNNIQLEELSEITGAEKGKLSATDLGLVVTDFLNQHFDQIMDYKFTANIEEEFDVIAGGKLKWNKMVKDFYTPFHEVIEDTLENAQRSVGERLLGNDPESGKPITARMGRFGPMVQIGAQEDEEKPRYARLRTNQSIETITLEDALELFKMPRVLGEFENLVVDVNIGRFGPYIRHDGKFYSIPKELDVYSISLDEATPIIVEKRQAKAENTIKEFEKEKIRILKGPYGPYIKQGLRNFKIPKEKIEQAADLSIEEVKAIIEEVKANPPKRKAAKKKA